MTTVTFEDSKLEALLTQAAKLSNVSFDEFVLNHARIAALKVIKEQKAKELDDFADFIKEQYRKGQMEKIEVSAKDYEFLLELSNNPPEPNDKLKAAFKRYYEEYLCP